MRDDDLVYVPGFGGPPVPLYAHRVSAQTAAGIRGGSWQYDLGRRVVSWASRAARECDIDVWFGDAEAADRLRRTFDRDVALGKPGRLVYRGEWSQRALFLGSAPSSISRHGHTSRLTVALLDGVWTRPVSVSLLPAIPSGDGLDMPYDMPFDLQATQPPETVEGPEWGPCAPLIRIYGYVASPVVTVGGNTYAVDCIVEEGGHLVIDGLERRVYAVGADGAVLDRFGDARRGSGAGSGEYIFERVPPGNLPITWDRTFGVDIGWYEEEGEPPWTS